MQVELLNWFGDDKMVVDVARVSYNKITDTFDEDKDVRLLNYLAKHKHTSPFRHPHLSFRINCPIYVERQLFKHQVGWTANSISGRYVDFSDTYELPDKLRLQSKNSKQGSDGFLDEEVNRSLLIKMNDLVTHAASLYEELVNAGVAKEQARIILPLCLTTTFVWTGSFQALIHLFDLRIKPDAQLETREVAEAMLACVKSCKGDPFKHSLAAFGY